MLDNYSLELTNLMLMSPDSIFSLMKGQFTSICLARMFKFA